MTEIYETRYYSIGLITDEERVVGIATDLKISKTSDGTVAVSYTHLTLPTISWV